MLIPGSLSSNFNFIRIILRVILFQPFKDHLSKKEKIYFYYLMTSICSMVEHTFECVFFLLMLLGFFFFAFSFQQLYNMHKIGIFFVFIFEFHNNILSVRENPQTLYFQIILLPHSLPRCFCFFFLSCPRYSLCFNSIFYFCFCPLCFNLDIFHWPVQFTNSLSSNYSKFIHWVSHSFTMSLILNFSFASFLYIWFPGKIFHLGISFPGHINPSYFKDRIQFLQIYLLSLILFFWSTWKFLT